MSRNVLLVNPPIYDFAAYDFFNKPLGLLYLSAFLRQAGYHLRLIDCMDRNHPSLQRLPGVPKTKPNGTGKYFSQIIDKPHCLKHVPRHYRRYGLPPEQLTAALEAENTNYPPLAVLVTSMMTYWYPAVVDTINLIRQIIPDLPIALGGVYATLMAQHAREKCRPDILFTGRAQITLLKWLDSLAGIERDYQGLDDNLSSWPDPAYELYSQLDYITVITSLGCPFRCEYCASGLLQPRLEMLKPQEVIEQIKRLLPLIDGRKGYYDIAFMDDALLVRAEDHIIPILQRLQDLNLPLRFHCPNGLHCRFITDQVAKLMYINNFRMIRLSFESSDAAGHWQRAGENKVANQDLIQAVQNLENAGFARRQLEAYILTGLPGQTMKEIESSADFVHNLGVQVRLCQYSPIPGTKLFEISCKEYGIDPAEPLLHNNSILPTLDKRITYETFQQFKDHVKQLNRALN